MISFHIYNVNLRPSMENLLRNNEEERDRIKIYNDKSNDHRSLPSSIDVFNPVTDGCCHVNLAMKKHSEQY